MASRDAGPSWISCFPASGFCWGPRKDSRSWPGTWGSAPGSPAEQGRPGHCGPPARRQPCPEVGAPEQGQLDAPPTHPRASSGLLTLGALANRTVPSPLAPGATASSHATGPWSLELCWEQPGATEQNFPGHRSDPKGRERVAGAGGRWPSEWTPPLHRAPDRHSDPETQFPDILSCVRGPTFPGRLPPSWPTHHCTGQPRVTQGWGRVSRRPPPTMRPATDQAQGRWSWVKNSRVALGQPRAAVRGDLANDTDQGLKTQGGQGCLPPGALRKGACCLFQLWGPRYFGGGRPHRAHFVLYVCFLSSLVRTPVTGHPTDPR